ncbi:MAG: glycosyltransferase family 1 protein [Chloroflexota bacterium]
MKIIINGWFWGVDTAGSGQYLALLLDRITGLLTLSQIQIMVVIPKSAAPASQKPVGVTADSVPSSNNVTKVFKSLPRLPRQIAKVWWEQVMIPQISQREKADLLWVPYWAAPYWQPTPTIVTIHDLIPLLLPAYRGGRFQRIYSSLVVATAKRSDAIITVSHASKQDVVQHLKIDPAKVHPIANGANTYYDEQNEAKAGLQKARLEQVRQQYALPQRFFLYLGGFDVRKNVQSILEGYRVYLEQGGSPEVKMVIGGKLPNMDSAFFPDPKRYADEVGLGGQVHFCGWVADEDKTVLYHLATAYFFPSLYEGFGMTVIEAMAAGTPVVTSKV